MPTGWQNERARRKAADARLATPVVYMMAGVVLEALAASWGRLDLMLIALAIVVTSMAARILAE